MKLIDFDKKGNVVRFYLGNDDLNDWWGDDWDDAPYEANAGTVYNQYISGYVDVAFSYDYVVCEPSEDWRHYGNSNYSKEDMQKNKIPMIVAVKEDDVPFIDNCFSRVITNKNAIKIYMGISLEEFRNILPKDAHIFGCE